MDPPGRLGFGIVSNVPRDSGHGAPSVWKTTGAQIHPTPYFADCKDNDFRCAKHPWVWGLVFVWKAVGEPITVTGSNSPTTGIRQFVFLVALRPSSKSGVLLEVRGAQH